MLPHSWSWPTMPTLLLTVLEGIMSRLSEPDVAIVPVLGLFSPRRLSHAEEGGAFFGEVDTGPATSAS